MMGIAIVVGGIYNREQEIKQVGTVLPVGYAFVANRHKRCPAVHFEHLDEE